MMAQLSAWGERIAHILGERVHYGTAQDAPSQTLIRQYFERFSLASLLPYQGYDPAKGLFYNEGSVGFVLETSPMIGCTEAMQREISGLFQHTLPEGSSLQFLLWADPRLGAWLNTWEQARTSQSEIFQALAEKRITFLKERLFGTDAVPLLRNFRCIVAYSESCQTMNPVQEERLLQLKSQIQAALKTLGMPVMTWDANALLNTLDGILNFNRDIRPADLKWNPYQSLNQQIPVPSTSYQVAPTGLTVGAGESLLRTYAVRREPDQWSLHAMGELIGDPFRDILQIPCPFLMHYGIHVCHQDKTKTRLSSRESWVENQAHSKIGKRIPILLQQSKELDFVRHQVSKGERFVQTHFTVTLLSTPDEMSRAAHVLTNLFRSKRWHLAPVTYLQLPVFLSTLPMMWGSGLPHDLGYFQELKTTLSSESANLLPLQGEWKGTSSLGLLLVGRRGQVLTWSPFDNQEGNYNVAVVGKSGSGKSVFMQELATSTLGLGGQVFVLDVGRSFQRTAKLLGGTYIEFTPEAPLCINPFSSLPAENVREAEDALAMLKPILSLMAAPQDGTNDLENAFLEKALKAVWKDKGNNAEISDIADFLQKNSNATAQRLGEKLFPYTKDGIYGRFFHGPATVDLSRAMVVIELEELKERKDLQEVIVQMMIVQITNRLYLGDRKTPSHVILDEAWDMLRGQQSGTFIETAARRLRKYRGSLVVGTQSVNDFYATPAAQVAFENCDWMCLLAQKPESIRQLKTSERIAMDPHMEALLTSVKTKQGHYAEVMLYGPHGYAVGRLILDPFSQTLYSTKPEEFAAIESLLKEGLSLTEAIQTIASRRRP